MVSETKKVGAEGPASKGKDKKAMQAAISGTEAIRGWDDHVIGIPKLCDRLKTHATNGLS